MTTARVWTRSTWALARAVLGVVLLGRAAAAQVDVDSLPGDQKGAKIPFQRSEGVVADPNCLAIVTFNFPYADLTIETVTVSLSSNPGVTIQASLETVVGGVTADHQIVLTPGAPYRSIPEGPLRRDFEATTSLRLHHLNKPNQPLKLLANGLGESCSYVLGLVTVAGYYQAYEPRQ